MLKPLFSVWRDLVGWIEPGRFVFDLNMGNVAFVANGQAWTPMTGYWLGPVHNDHLYDMNGRAVAWSTGLPLVDNGGAMRQIRAIAPVTPVRPVKPVPPKRPLSAPESSVRWSELTFAEWCVAGLPEWIRNPVATPGEPASRPEGENRTEPGRSDVASEQD